ncbi:hypothetical protein EG835_06060 [bacterium]|nr:hypothetical protein [bacterium]
MRHVRHGVPAALHQPLRSRQRCRGRGRRGWRVRGRDHRGGCLIVTRGDRLLIVVLVVVSLLAWPMLAVASTAGELVEISGPAGVTRASLSEDAALHVPGTSGEVLVIIEDGRVHVESSSCPDQVCVESGEVEASGSVIACVPNQVVIQVGEGGGDALDARIR